MSAEPVPNSDDERRAALAARVSALLKDEDQDVDIELSVDSEGEEAAAPILMRHAGHHTPSKAVAADKTMPTDVETSNAVPAPRELSVDPDVEAGDPKSPAPSSPFMDQPSPDAVSLTETASAAVCVSDEPPSLAERGARSSLREQAILGAATQQYAVRGQNSPSGSARHAALLRSAHKRTYSNSGKRSHSKPPLHRVQKSHSDVGHRRAQGSQSQNTTPRSERERRRRPLGPKEAPVITLYELSADKQHYEVKVHLRRPNETKETTSATTSATTSTTSLSYVVHKVESTLVAPNHPVVMRIHAEFYKSHQLPAGDPTAHLHTALSGGLTVAPRTGYWFGAKQPMYLLGMNTPLEAAKFVLRTHGYE